MNLLINKILLILAVTLPIFLHAQVIDTTNGSIILQPNIKYIRGKITEVDHTKKQGLFITIYDNATNASITVLTPNYIRGQKEFYILKDSVNVMPPPLHVTNMWVSDNKMFIETSEPTVLTLYHRNWGWKDSGVQWGKQHLKHDYGYTMAHGYSFNPIWFDLNDWKDDWDFAFELSPRRYNIPEWSLWMHEKTFYLATWRH